MVARSSRPLPLGAGRCLSRLYLAVARASPPCRGRVPLGQGRASRCLTGPTEGPCGRSHASGVVWPSAYHPGPLGLRVACPALPLWPWRGVALCSLPALGCPRPAGRSPPARVAAAGPRVWARWVSPRPHRLWERSRGVAAPGAGGSDVGGWRHPRKPVAVGARCRERWRCRIVGPGGGPQVRVGERVGSLEAGCRRPRRATGPRGRVAVASRVRFPGGPGFCWPEVFPAAPRRASGASPPAV